MDSPGGLITAAIPTAIERTRLGRGMPLGTRMINHTVAHLTNDPGWEDLKRTLEDKNQTLVPDDEVDTVVTMLERKAEEQKTLGFFALFDYDFCVPVADRAFPARIDTALKDFANRNATSRAEDWQARVIDGPELPPETWGVHAYLDPMVMLAGNYYAKTLNKGETVDGSRPWDSMGKGTFDNTAMSLSLGQDFQRLPSQVEI